MFLKFSVCVDKDFFLYTSALKTIALMLRGRLAFYAVVIVDYMRDFFFFFSNTAPKIWKIWQSVVGESY